MEIGRRNFIRTSALVAAGGLVTLETKSMNKITAKSKKGLQLSFEPFELKLRHTFTVAGNSRTTTPVVLTRIKFDGKTGYGESSMPPYLGESHESVLKFLNSLDLSQFDDPFRMDDILGYVDKVAPGNPAAKASVDIALHDLCGKMTGYPWYRIWGLSPEKAPNTSFTIGIDTADVVRQKTKEAVGFKILKVKLGRENDREMIETIRSVTDVPLCVDANQGWKSKEQGLENIHWLKEKGVVFVEQPMAKENIDDAAWLTQHSPLPIMADEAVQRLGDVKKVYGAYSGINIKLMKSTGLHEAYKMAILAKSLGMKVMIGCMTETSCAVTAAAQISPLADWADLDGNLLISNDPFEGIKIVDGKVTIPDRPGIGIVKAKV